MYCLFMKVVCLEKSYDLVFGSLWLRFCILKKSSNLGFVVVYLYW